jgi:hypothetical protein
VVQTTDGGYFLGGFTNANGYDVLMFKLKPDGSFDTSFNGTGAKTYGDSNSQKGYSVVQTADGGYAVAGDTSVNGYDFLLIKMDAAGSYQ